MKKHLVPMGITFFWLASLFLTQVSPAFAQDWQVFSSDLDGDGLLNDLETAGWYNKAGGPFYTDPYDADSDDDGLTDGEEKLYDTIPVNGPTDLNGAKSPGMYVKYQDSFHTKEYFRVADPAYLSMKQGGGRYLMTEAMVVRRGATLRIGGPSNATLTVSGSGLTTLTPQKDPCQGGWIVSLPSYGTVGTYTATVSLGGWQKQMPIYVIFELPLPTGSSLPLETTLTQEGIESFLYNDTPSNVRDETAIIWYTGLPVNYTCRCDEGCGPPCYDANDFYHNSYGWSQAFYTEQYRKYIFVDKVMPRIHGKTSQSAATDALSDGADEEVRVNYSYFGQAGQPGQPLSYQIAFVLNRYFDGIGWTQPGTPCHSQAGTFSSFLRSAGIPARPFITDWSKTQYDTSVLVWLSGEWYAARSYAGSETSDTDPPPYGYKYYPFERGHTYQRYLRDWDTYANYGEHRSDLLITANEDWDWEMVNTGHVGDDLTAPTLEYSWDSIRPLQMQIKHPYADTLNSIVWKGEPWLPTGWFSDAYHLPNPYPGGDMGENWPIEPVPRRCPLGFTGDCPYPPAGGLGALDMPIGAGGQPALGIQPALQAQSNLVQLGTVVGDHGVDLDGNGRFDKLIVEVEVTAFQPGNYTIGGALLLGEGSIVYADSVHVYLHEGLQTVQLPFDSLAIGFGKVDGPYQVIDLWITDLQDFDPKLGPWDKVLDQQQPGYITNPYTADQFEAWGAFFSGVYSHRGLDQDGDGRYEVVAIDVALDISLPGTYQVEGDLYDSEGNFVGHATWTGSGSLASLQFELEKTTPPYQLENLRLFDSIGALLDSRARDAYTITDLGGLVKQGAVTMDIYPLPESGGIAPLGLTITPTHVFNDTGVDLDGDVAYDQLVVDVQVQVSQADQYRVEGWLEGPDGSLIAYALSNPASLGTGLQTLSLPFDGRAINGRGMDGPYTVIALRILDGSTTSYDVLDEVKVTGLALDYEAADFELATDVPFAFNDDMESDTDNWTWGDPPWSLNSSMWYSPSHAWRAYGSQSGSLTATLDLSKYGDPVLRLNTCYQMSSANDVGYIEVSANGVDWTRVATYTNSTSYWTLGLVDLSDFSNTAGLQLRFRANSQSWLRWYVDDVSINGVPDDDGDGLSNEEEGDGDTDGDGVPDYLEPNDEDTDNDGYYDYQDPDDDGDGIPTANEDPNGNSDPADDDSDNDGVPDYLDRDDDGDGVYTDHENADPNGDGNPADAQDSDNDGLPDYLDRDDDGDGVYTNYERPDPNGDGNPDDADDTDSDGVPDYLDRDDDGDGLYTSYENADPNGNHNPSDAKDTDGDGEPDYLDWDDDGDGIYTNYERPDPNGDGNPDDAWNTDGFTGGTIPNYLDPDDDGDGIPTNQENADSNGDGNPDDAQDTDGDHVPDYWEPNNGDTDNDETYNYLDADDDGDSVPTADEDWNRDGDPTNDDGDDDGIPDYLDPDVFEAPISSVYLPMIFK